MKKSKAILMALCAVLLVAASVMGTLAYLTSTDSVTNTFTVGNVKITLDEAKVNVNGQKLDANNNVYEETGSVNLAARVDNNTYKLLPGHEYAKDPIIHVTKGSSDCYLFVKVENGIAAIEDTNNTIHSQMTGKGWVALGDSYPGVYYYTENESLKVISAADTQVDVPVFDKFIIAGNVTDDATIEVPSEDEEGKTEIVDNVRQLRRFNEAKVVVTAYAIQADGFAGKPAADIWATAKFN